jgi:hypothetical protein
MPKWVLAVASAVVVALIVTLVVGLTSKSESNNKTKASAGEIFLTANKDPGPNPFTPNVGAQPPTTMTPLSLPLAGSTTTATAVTPTSRPAGTVTGYSGAEIGLYGGTRNLSSCDAQQMITYLNQNPAKAAAWAATEGISASEINDYIGRLTPVVLRADTRVTNHGFRNGRANAIQEVLQAGTAVLVDQYGVPRARCFCGNPLTPPVPVSSTPSYQGSQWPAFNPTTIVVVNNSTTIINNFTLVDVVTGQPYNRQAGGALTGVTDTDAPSLTPSPQAPSVPSSLQDVVGSYANLKITTSGDCSGFTSNPSSTTFRVTVADPARGVVTIVTSTGTYSGTLGQDYSFHFTDSTSSTSLDGRFQQQGGKVVMSGSVPLGTCTVSFSADKVG